MDNHERRVRYAQARYGISRDVADADVRTGYALGREHLTPAQRRRIRHKRGTSSYGKRREAARQRDLRDLAHWGGATPGKGDSERVTGATIRQLKARLREAGWKVR